MRASRFFWPAILVGATLVGGNSCRQSNSGTGERTPGTSNSAFFFDLAEFFKQEEQRLKGRLAQKTLVFNQKKEQRPKQILDYATELAVFSNSDINKPSWRDKYRCDTLVQQDSLLRVRFRALDPQLKTRSIEIEWRAGQVWRIDIHNRLKSIIAQAEERLQYQPAEGYTIRGTQAMRWAKKSSLEVTVVFLPQQTQRRK